MQTRPLGNAEGGPKLRDVNPSVQESRETGSFGVAARRDLHDLRTPQTPQRQELPSAMGRVSGGRWAISQRLHTVGFGYGSRYSHTRSTKPFPLPASTAGREKGHSPGQN